jgi:hypothetical protein
MKRRRTKEKFMKDCKTIGEKIQNVIDTIGYYPTYRELGYTFKFTYTTMYNVVQEAIRRGWLSKDITEHYRRKSK